MNRPLAGRHAGYDDNGTPLADFDVLSAEELAEDYGYPSADEVFDPFASLDAGRKQVAS